MIWIFLKLILAFVISAIPFVVKYYVIPKSKVDAKYRNSLTMLASYAPFFKAKYYLAKKAVINFFRKVEISKKHRRFFQLLLLLVMMVVQLTNANASISSFRILCNTQYYMETFEHSKINVLGLFKVNSGLGWNTVIPMQNLVLMICILLLLRYKFMDKILTVLNENRKLQVVVFSAILIFLFEPSGSSFMMAEFLYLLILGSFLCPRTNKTKSMKFYSIKTIKASKRQ